MIEAKSPIAEWVYSNRTWLYPLLLLAYAILVFWSVVAIFSLSGRLDTAHYLPTGLMWLDGVMDYGDLYRPNRVYAILCALLVKVIGVYEFYPIITWISFPAFLVAVFFLYKTFEELSDSGCGFWATFLIVSLPSVNLLARYPLPEIVMLAMLAVVLYFTVSQKVSPFVIGLLLGGACWVRTPVLMYVPLWPVLFAGRCSIRQFVRSSALYFFGVAIPILCQYYVDSAVGLSGYEHTFARKIVYDFDAVIKQLKRLSVYDGELLFYIVGLGTVLIRDIWKRHWRLWLLAAVPLGLLFLRAFVYGRTLRPGVFLCIYVPLVFLTFVLIRKAFDFFYMRNKNIRWAVPVVVILLIVLGGRAQEVIRWRTEPEAIARRLHNFPLDHREAFARLPEGAIVGTEGLLPFLWTRMNMLNGDVRLLVCPESLPYRLDKLNRSRQESCVGPRVYSTRESFQKTIDLVNGYTEKDRPTAIAVWRQGDPDNMIFPDFFEDWKGVRFVQVEESRAPGQAFALYSKRVEAE